MSVSTAAAISTYTCWLQSIQQDRPPVKRCAGNVGVSEIMVTEKSLNSRKVEDSSRKEND